MVKVKLNEIFEASMREIIFRSIVEVGFQTEHVTVQQRFLYQKEK